MTSFEVYRCDYCKTEEREGPRTWGALAPEGWLRVAEPTESLTRDRVALFCSSHCLLNWAACRIANEKALRAHDLAAAKLAESVKEA